MSATLSSTLPVGQILCGCVNIFSTYQRIFSKAIDGIAVTYGVDEESILGPDLRNVSNNSLLKINMPMVTNLVDTNIAVRDVNQSITTTAGNDRIRSYSVDERLCLYPAFRKMLTRKHIQTIISLPVIELNILDRSYSKVSWSILDQHELCGDKIRRTV